jgi:hypothetical protein
MPLIRYELTLPADARRHVTAFAPVPASTIAKWSNAMAQGWTLSGQPGTRAIPAPYADVGPSARPGSALPGGGGGAGNTGTRYMPPRWYPSQYYARQWLWGGIGGVAAAWLVNGNGGPSAQGHPSAPAADTRWVPGKYRLSWPWMRQRPVMSGPVTPRWRWWRPRDAPEKER